MKRQDIKHKIGAHTLSKNKAGNLVARWGFFYTHGMTGEQKAKKVLSVFPKAIILSYGMVWKDFRGGAPLARQSHFYVEFTLE